MPKNKAKKRRKAAEKPVDRLLTVNLRKDGGIHLKMTEDNKPVLGMEASAATYAAINSGFRSIFKSMPALGSMLGLLTGGSVSVSQSPVTEQPPIDKVSPAHLKMHEHLDNLKFFANGMDEKELAEFGGLLDTLCTKFQADHPPKPAKAGTKSKKVPTGKATVVRRKTKSKLKGPQPAAPLPPDTKA